MLRGSVLKSAVQACGKSTQTIAGHAKSGALACSSLSPALQQVCDAEFQGNFSSAEAPGLYSDSSQLTNLHVNRTCYEL